LIDSIETKYQLRGLIKTNQLVSDAMLVQNIQKQNKKFFKKNFKNFMHFYLQSTTNALCSLRSLYLRLFILKNLYV